MRLRLLLLFALQSLLAGLSVAQTASNHYVYFANGDVEAYPEEYVRTLETTDGYRLTLINDSIITWTATEVDSVTSIAPTYPQFTDFKFNDNLNEQLVNDVPGTIAGDRVTATVAAIGKWLTPTYKLSDRAAVAYVDGVAQQSGISRRRFADEVVYTLGYPNYRRLSAEKISDEVWSEGSVGIEEIALTADMLSTNAPSGRGEGLENLVDGMPTTFFHSTWSNDPLYEKLPENEYPYISVAVPQPISALKFYYQGRIDTNNRNPYAFRVYASHDNAVWNEVAYFDESTGIPTTEAGAEFTSPTIEANEAYRYWKFEQTACAYKNYLVLSTFRLYEVTDVVEPELIEPARYDYRMMPLGREVAVDVTWLTDEATAVPRIDIDIDGGQMVSSKEYYLNALITIQGNGVYADFQDSVQIKGRGNSSWSSNPYAKNPYRLKFASSVKPFGLKKGKNWNLIAQSQTGSMMSNPMAMKAARMVGTAGANNVIPVDLYVNGEYRGSYIFTQKTGLANNSIDLSDESAAVFLELDTYYDETYRFYSNKYSLPVNIKEPDFSEGETVLDMAQVKTDFNRFETSLYEGTNFERFVDLEMLARFMLVNELVLNAELNHPKSTFLHKENLNHLGSPYVFGPAWDFDWAYGYESNRQYCTSSPTAYLFGILTSGKGNRFFSDLWQASDLLKRRYYALWKDFVDNHLEEYIDYADDYLAYANSSFINNSYKWGDGGNYATVAENMKSWLTKRAHYILDNLTPYDLDAPIDYPYGDINLDGEIDIADRDLLSDYLMEISKPGTRFAQADVDATGEITIGDMAWLCDMIGDAAVASARQYERGWATIDDDDEDATPASYPLKAPEEEVVSADGIGVLVSEVTPGMEWNLVVSMENVQPYTAFQLDVTLPDGVNVFDDFVDLAPASRIEGTHTLRGGYLSDGRYRIIGYSDSNASYAGTTGALFTLLLTADRELAVGTYPLAIDNVRMLTSAGFENALSAIDATMYASETSIDTPHTAPYRITYYTIEGKPLTAPRPGVVICRKVYSDGHVEVVKKMY